jgi:deoxyribonuclease V
VSYPPDGGAIAAVVICSDARYATVTDRRTVRLADVERYRPGEFYCCELPALRAVLADAGPLDLLIVDGHVDLDPDGRTGLGAHAHAEFDVPVIGVAKTAFTTATHAIPVHRGQATRALYVTAAGIPCPRPPTSSAPWPAPTTCPTPCGWSTASPEPHLPGADPPTARPRHPVGVLNGVEASAPPRPCGWFLATYLPVDFRTLCGS